MKKLFLIIVAIAAFGCRIEVKPTKQAVLMKSDSTIARPTINMQDPAIYGGANILACFMAELRAQDYTAAMDMTTPESIRRFGRDKVLKRYRAIDINYKPVLLSIQRYTNDSCRLRFKIWRVATSRFTDIISVVVDDTAKIVLPDRLQDFLH